MEVGLGLGVFAGDALGIGNTVRHLSAPWRCMVTRSLHWHNSAPESPPSPSEGPGAAAGSSGGNVQEHPTRRAILEPWKALHVLKGIELSPHHTPITYPYSTLIAPYKTLMIPLHCPYEPL